MVIEIKIRVSGILIEDSYRIKHTTLIENSLVIRRLEEIKQKLLDKEYKTDLEIEGE